MNDLLAFGAVLGIILAWFLFAIVVVAGLAAIAYAFFAALYAIT
jgi:hypothetical protein